MKIKFLYIIIMMLVFSASTSTLTVRGTDEPPAPNLLPSLNILSMSGKEVPDPVLLEVKALSVKGMDNAQIIAELELKGMGWNPKTNDTWTGRLLTPEEISKLPPREPFLASSPNVFVSETFLATENSPLPKSFRMTKALSLPDIILGTENLPSLEALPMRASQPAVRTLQTTGTAFIGFYDVMIPGSLETAEGYSEVRYATHHIGRFPSDGSRRSWTELLVARIGYGSLPSWIWYDNDDNNGGEQYITLGTKEELDTSDTYAVIITDTIENGEYVYQAYLNNYPVGRGHIPWRQCMVDQQNEVYSSVSLAGPYGPTETIWALYSDPYLMNIYGQWMNWGPTISTTCFGSIPSPFAYNLAVDQDGQFSFLSRQILLE